MRTKAKADADRKQNRHLEHISNTRMTWMIETRRKDPAVFFFRTRNRSKTNHIRKVGIEKTPMLKEEDREPLNKRSYIHTHRLIAMSANLNFSIRRFPANK